MKHKLLINWAYYNPVGHLFEALHHAYGYYAANHAAVNVYLVLNAASPLEFVRACLWVAGIYPISFADVLAQREHATCLQAVPQVWDYLITDPRVRPTALTPGWDEEDLIVTQTVLQQYLQATVWSGFSRGWQCRWNTTGLIGIDDPLPYAANARFQLPIPPQAQTFVEQYRHHGPTICVIPGGSGGLNQSPSLAAWVEMLKALAEALPNLRVYMIGVSRSVAGRTHTVGFTPADIDRLRQRLPFVSNCFDIGLWNQVALIAACDVLCAPHTGFAFISQFVGTPWLAVSGCPWPEYVFNGTPFYSVIPNCASYPAEGDPTRECTQRLERGEKTVCMTDEHLRQRLPDLIRGVQLLLSPGVTYEQSVQVHKANLLRQGRDPKQFKFFFDDAT